MSKNQKESTFTGLHTQPTQEHNLDIGSNDYSLDNISHKAQLLIDYNNCYLCGTELTFTHTSHFTELVVNEEAYCDCCKIKCKSDTHILQ